MKNNQILLVSGRGKGKFVLVFDLNTRKVVKKIETIKDYRYSGHSIVLKDKIILSLRKVTNGQPYSTEEGRLAVLDIDSAKITKTVSSKGIAPHDIVHIPNTKFFAVSHYGSHIKDDDKSPFVDTASGTCVNIFNQDNLELVDSHKISTGAHFSHFTADKYGNLYLPAMRYVKKNEAGRQELHKRLKDLSLDLPLTMNEYYKKRISLPEPIYVYNIHTKKGTELIPSPLSQRRPQSAYYHQESDQVMITFSHSNTLAVIDPKTKKINYLNAHQFGISDIRGVTAGTSNERAFISSNHYGMVEFDLKNLRPIQRINQHTFRTVHIYKC